MFDQVVGANEKCHSSSSVNPGIAFSAGSSGPGWGPEKNGTSVFGEACKLPDYKLANSLFEAFSSAPGSGMVTPKVSLDHQPGQLGARDMPGSNNSELSNPFCTSGFEDDQNSIDSSLDAFDTLGELLPE